MKKKNEEQKELEELKKKAALADEFKDKYDNIPWKVIAGMRDRLIHGYDTVNLPLLWKTVKNDLPILQKAVKKIKEDISF